MVDPVGEEVLRLTPLGQSPHPAMTLDPSQRTVVGRSVTADVVLEEPTVSRAHAAFAVHGGQWFVTDLASTTGTRVNGQRLEPHKPAAISQGDLVRLGPVAFRVSIGETHAPSSIRTINDGRQAMAIDLAPPDRRVAALAEALQRFSGAPSESELASMLVRTAVAETGFARAALLDSAAPEGDSVGVLASFDARGGDAPSALRVSTSLASIARTGKAAGVAARRPGSHGASIAEMHVTGALCLPIRLAEDVVALLYLDTRDDEPAARPHATDAAAALATAYALASANLKRIDLERRHQRLRADLDAAREAQRMLLPPDVGVVGCARYALHLRPGDFIAGDLFDALELDDGRAAFIVGDVTGHGVGPGLIMSTAQATLRATLRADPDPERAVNRLNEDLCARLAAGRFVSLWLAILDRSGTLTVVDAGHGHAMLSAGEGSLPISEDIPVGIDPDHRYRATSMLLPADAAVVAYSDGVTEQRGANAEEFGVGGLRDSVRRAGAGPEAIVRAVADALERHSPGVRDDDATIAAIARV